MRSFITGQHSLFRRFDCSVISLTDMHSCGTATAYSVPCMFSIYPREQYDEQQAAATESLVDVLQHAGVHILWRDNNSDSKGVALRVKLPRFQAAKPQPGVRQRIAG